MLTQETCEKLHQMRLGTMARALREQLDTPDACSLSFEERFGLLVDREWTGRQNRRLGRLLREARFRLSACPEDIDWRHPRGLDKAFLRTLFGGTWLGDRRNVIITGSTGVGKTFIACALGNAACRQGRQVRYYRVPRLVQDLDRAKGDGSYSGTLSKLARADLVILDDWGLAPLTAAEGRDLLEVIDDRSMLRSTVVASQLPLELWHGVVADPTVADAILDRLVHNAHKIFLTGESMRKAMAGDTSNEQAESH